MKYPTYVIVRRNFVRQEVTELAALVAFVEVYWSFCNANNSKLGPDSEKKA
jgi:hypothetical protein